jgi:large subunit ribosomal protein L17
MIDGRTTTAEVATDRAQNVRGSAKHEAHVREIERAEARAAAERAAEEQAEQAARDAETAGESAARRMAAGEAAAEQAEVDTAEAERAGPVGTIPNSGAGERQDAVIADDGMRQRGAYAEVPVGAIAGDGTANCPPDYPVKGNRQSRIYHRPGQSSYASTVAEFCFGSEEAAEGAGFRASRARGQRTQA